MDLERDNFKDKSRNWEEVWGLGARLPCYWFSFLDVFTILFLSVFLLSFPWLFRDLCPSVFLIISTNNFWTLFHSVWGGERGVGCVEKKSQTIHRVAGCSSSFLILNEKTQSFSKWRKHVRSTIILLSLIVWCEGHYQLKIFFTGKII